MDKSLQIHWDTVYKTKNPDEVSWTQVVPKTSLNFIESFSLSKTAKIIDIGGGDSKLVDFLLKEGYEDITVLDISEHALDKSKKRLGENADKIKWIVSDITDFEPDTTYNIWHDRAAFHFLQNNEQVFKYVSTARNFVSGYLVLGTFSDNGPDKCSGLSVKQYNEESLSAELQKSFKKIRCITEDHLTPFGKKQNFLFCSFKRSDG